MLDFTLQTYKVLLQSLLNAGYVFQTFADFLREPVNQSIILRHDVDALPGNSLATAQLENELGVIGSYYFRIVPQSNQPGIIREIVELKHEVGYHYEDFAICKGNMDEAIISFQQNLKYFRQFGPVNTICMHGSPRSKYDNRKLWDHYNYKDYGIIGEPYFDVYFNKVLYLTDTGRRWNGEKVSIRDHVDNKPDHNFKTTFDLINAISELPDQIMLTVHPQRWDNNPISWIKEYVMQNLKNIVKRRIVKLRARS